MSPLLNPGMHGNDPPRRLQNQGEVGIAAAAAPWLSPRPYPQQAMSNCFLGDGRKGGRRESRVRFTEASHCWVSEAVRGVVINKDLVSSNVSREMGGQLVTVNNWAAALKHRPDALAQASSHCFWKEGEVRGPGVRAARRL